MLFRSKLGLTLALNRHVQMSLMRPSTPYHPFVPYTSAPMISSTPNPHQPASDITTPSSLILDGALPLTHRPSFLTYPHLPPSFPPARPRSRSFLPQGPPPASLSLSLSRSLARSLPLSLSLSLSLFLSLCLCLCLSLSLSLGQLVTITVGG